MFLMVLSCTTHTVGTFFSAAKTTKIVIKNGDITQSSCQAIVNAANEQLLGGAGGCGAIFNAAGWLDLQRACDNYPAYTTVRCPVGQACITDSFNLKARGIQYIVHAVGPDCRIIKDPKQQDILLEAVYKNALIVADKNNIKSIAFPFISSAIYAFPKERACEIALKTVTEYTKGSTSLEKIEFVLFSQADYDLFCKIFADIEGK